MIDFTKSETLHTRGIFVMAGAVGLLIFATFGLPSQTLVSEQAARASFRKDGKLELPADYRQWAHVGSRYKVGGMNILDGTAVKIPQVLDTYVEPSALAHYKQTGTWPQGAQIVKELIEVKGGKGCDSTTFCLLHASWIRHLRRKLHRRRDDGERQQALPRGARQLGILRIFPQSVRVRSHGEGAPA